MTDFTRRTALATGAAAALASLISPTPSLAVAPPSGRQAPGVYRYRVGDFEMTSISDGVGIRKLDDKFVRNATVDQVKAALEEAFLPTDRLTIPYTQLVVNTGGRLVLLDAGTGARISLETAGLMMDNLAAAGIDPRAIDTVIISHFHADHIFGLVTRDGQPAFPNAEILVPEPEWAYWTDEGQASRAPESLRMQFENVRKTFEPIRKVVKRYDGNTEILPGIEAISAHGHTPGHMVFRVTSGSDHLLVLSDTTNHPALFVRNPGWHAMFDMDPEMAEASRRRILDMAAADRTRVQSYHFPFPATGHIAKDGDRYAFVPSAWTSVL